MCQHLFNSKDAATRTHNVSSNFPRLFCDAPLKTGETVDLNTPQSHYLLHVLRLKDRAQVLLFNGVDGEWLSIITVSRRGTCVATASEQTREQTAPQDLHYVFAPLKQARLDYTIQKAVEMGVSLIQPVITARTVVARLNPERMRANAIEAAEQCNILSVPAIAEPVKLNALLKGWEKDRALIFCDEKAATGSPLSALQGVTARKRAVLIGPEGGFTEEERRALLRLAFVHPISLGPRILRADTAAVAALALVNAVLGDWR